MREHRFHIEEGTWAHALFRCAMMALLTAAFLAIEILLIYAWWTNYHIWVLWFVLMLAAVVGFGALLMALADADRIIF